AELTTQYDCDGAMTVKLTYGSNEPTKVDSLDLVMDLTGQVDTLLSTAEGGGGMASADKWECALPQKEGVVWDSAQLEYPELFYTHFVPWLWFGSGDRAFTWICDSDQAWTINREGSTMKLVRDAQGQTSLHVHFVNCPNPIEGKKTIEFMLLTHPSK